MDVGEKDVGKLYIHAAIHESKQVLEHPGCGSRGRHELGELIIFTVLLEGVGHLFHLVVGHADDAVADGGCTHKLDVCGAPFQLSHLLVHLFFRNVPFFDLL